MVRHLARRAAVVALAVAALSPAGVAEGAVRAGLTASSPPAQAVLPTAPRSVTLTFASTPDADRSHLAVVDGSGRRVSSADEPIRQGDTLTQSVSIDTPGDFTVAYHVEFTDGREVDGWLRFSVGTGLPPPPPSRAEREANAALVTTHQHGVDPVSAIVLVINALVVVGVVVMLRLTRPAADENLDDPRPRRLFRMPVGWSDGPPPDPDGPPRVRS